MNPITFQEALIAAHIDNPCQVLPNALWKTLSQSDTTIGKVSLEWIQVLPAYRGRSLANAMVLEQLTLLQDRTTFTTVSGRVNNHKNPERLYRRCGSTGEDVWWVLRR